MPKHFSVKGINPIDRIVAFIIVAETESDAKAKAEDAGLKFVVVQETQATTAEVSTSSSDLS
jgi:hypothetical protein